MKIKPEPYTIVSLGIGWGGDSWVVGYYTLRGEYNNLWVYNCHAKGEARRAANNILAKKKERALCSQAAALKRGLITHESDKYPAYTVVKMRVEGNWGFYLTYRPYCLEKPREVLVYRPDDCKPWRDEMDAYRFALKYLAKLKARADERRAQRAQAGVKELEYA